MSQYDIRWVGGVVGIINIPENNLWIANDLKAADKLIVSSIASALLKRMQDVDKDKDQLEDL